MSTFILFDNHILRAQQYGLVIKLFSEHRNLAKNCFPSAMVFIFLFKIISYITIEAPVEPIV